MNQLTSILLLFSASLLAACTLPSKQTQREPAKGQGSPNFSKDPHSYSNPELVKVRHVDLDLQVSFDKKILEGSATLTVERATGSDAVPLVLDTQDLKIARVETAQSPGAFQPSPFTLGTPDKILGSSLTIQLPPTADRVRIHYSSSPVAGALQWLTPAQTAGKTHPFLFSQSEAIYARTWIPLQDTPSVRLTYAATIRTPRELRALMSAENDPQTPRSGEYRFKMTEPIPSYLVTPTIIAGDKSLVSLIAHELAHSWSGNLVTNATWSDFWLNEGFTNYVTHRILESVYGRERAAMEEVLERQELLQLLKTLPEADQILHINLAGRNPEEGVTDIPYAKGATFLRHLEKAYGRARFDSFVRSYFDHFAFQSIRTSDFVHYLNQHLIASGTDPSQPNVPVDEWIYKPGIPTGAPQPSSEAFAKVEQQAQQWIRGQVPATKLQTSQWSYHEWKHFLRSLPTPLPQERMAQLDAAFHFSQSGNSEMVQQWLLMAIQNDYAPAYPKLEEFLVSVGRRKFLRPLYSELAKTEGGGQRALSIYRKARPSYHPIAAATIDEILKWKEESGN